MNRFNELFQQLLAALPPVASWWLDPRSASYRQQVLTELHQRSPWRKLEDNIEYIHQWTIAPVPVLYSSQGAAPFIGANRGFALEQTMSASHVVQTVNTWFPDDAPQMLHCLSPLWDLRIADDYKHNHNLNHTIKHVPVYTDVLHVFGEDPVAQRILVYQGHLPRENDPSELHILKQQLTDKHTRPLPWSMYEDLSLSMDAILQAERARDHGLDEFNINTFPLMEGPAIN